MQVEVSRFLDSLDDNDRMLLDVLEVLYEGSWRDLLKDLRAARDGEPFVFKIADRVEQDIERVERMAAFEKQYGVKLKRLLGETSQ